MCDRTRRVPEPAQVIELAPHRLKKLKVGDVLDLDDPRTVEKLFLTFFPFLVGSDRLEFDADGNLLTPISIDPPGRPAA